MPSQLGSIIIIWSDSNIGLNLDIQRQFVTKVISLAPTINLRLHLQILWIRRKGTILRQNMRVADIGIDVVRRVAAVGSVLQTKRWEQPTDDGKTRTDQSN